MWHEYTRKIKKIARKKEKIIRLKRKQKPFIIFIFQKRKSTIIDRIKLNQLEQKPKEKKSKSKFIPGCNTVSKEKDGIKVYRYEKVKFSLIESNKVKYCLC